MRAQFTVIFIVFYILFQYPKNLYSWTPTNDQILFFSLKDIFSILFYSNLHEVAHEALTQTANMWLLNFLLFSFVEKKMAIYFGYSIELVSLDDVITEFQSSVSSCFIRCQSNLGCVKAAFRNEPIIGKINSCLLLKQPVTGRNGEMISLVVGGHVSMIFMSS